MNLKELLGRITLDPNCVVFPTAGQPVVEPPHVVPEDVREFYDACGGLIIGQGAFYQARFVGPQECVLANDVMLGESAAVVRERQADDLSWNWYIIAEVENGNHLAMDFGARHNGRCYEASWDNYGLIGQMPVIAASLTPLIERLFTNKGQSFFWLEPEFHPLGDAYDA